ncbi:MAG: DegV family EDD domain-containing protein [Deltaproteobacteria bacterium]|nr:DegV family EDD domain-containing protein [Deltaproteobacteria bacterium]
MNRTDESGSNDQGRRYGPGTPGSQDIKNSMVSDRTLQWLDALESGAKRLSQYSGLLDAINVFPVADGDTGINMSCTVAPLLDLAAAGDSMGTIRQRLLLAARGNSGNLLCSFLDRILSNLEKGWPGFQQAAYLGRQEAYSSVGSPVEGTILSVMDVLVERSEFSKVEFEPSQVEAAREILETTVLETMIGLPVLSSAGVVDAGALGLFFFLEGVLYRLHGLNPPEENRFKGMKIRPGWRQETWVQGPRYCADFALKTEKRDQAEILSGLDNFGESVEILQNSGVLKVHMHTNKPEKLREYCKTLGPELAWHLDDMNEQVRSFISKRRVDPRTGPRAQPIEYGHDVPSPWHDSWVGRVSVAVDAAASMDRQVAGEFGIKLFYSYIYIKGDMKPECDVDKNGLYELLKKSSEPVTTARASEEEIWAGLENLAGTEEAVLYLTAGSQYTGTYDAASRWKEKQGGDPGDKFRIIDSLAASGQLALLAYVCAREAEKVRHPAKLLAFARTQVQRCKEYISLDTLKYLARGGRMSKIGAFLGNAAGIKPVIEHKKDGAGKAGVVRSRQAALDFILARFMQHFSSAYGRKIVLLEYTDAESRRFVLDIAAKRVECLGKDFELLVWPMSATAGVHMGPGTWAMAGTWI